MSTRPPFIWLDLPHSADFVAPAPIPPDVQAALERFAGAIAAVKEPQVSFLAHYFSVDPGRIRFNNITRRLAADSLASLLHKMTASGRAPSSAALPDSTVAALARKTLLSRILDPSRIEALQRACETVSTSTIKGGPF
ncbi:hypothetical protein [uncultured Rhodoblastus sp.]|uniref:hypothetical protein n=1 Tax=uncultured Rhodoblastus sp. TaxID=543037 RepID=UPI0025F73FB3|nr:hypothetical protein [uncultured Rhodoblastus sp.]